MYKSKLQELCQQKGWPLPLYSTIKDGPDHNPSFTATVTVAGLPFHASDHSRTAKEAQNKAATLAFHHFCGSPNLPPTPAAPASSSSPSDAVTSLDNTKLLNEAPSEVKDDMPLKDMRHGYKNWLQNYTQMRNLKLPVYSFEREGPPHASRFKSKVTVDGISYESPKFFSTIKEADQAAAQVASKSLSLNVVQVDTGIYKNLLQELARKEGFDMPKYETAASGLPHLPTFVSTVKVGEKSFIGAAAKNKKQAEMNAAKVAYIDLCEQTRHCGLVERHNRDEERTKCSELPAIKEPVSAIQAPIDLPSGIDIKKALDASSTFLQSLLSGHEDQSVPEANYVIPLEEHTGGEDKMLKSSNSEPPPVEAAAGATNSRMRTRTLVFPRGSSLALPEGATELPHSDEKWVALKVNLRE